jgi:hypothetical protein
MLHALGYSGPLIIEVALTSIQRVPWLYGSGRVYAQPGSPLDDDVPFSLTTTSAALREKPDDIAADVLRCVLFSVNWPDWTDTDLTDMIRMGRRCNGWLET